jgi:hypothetical protein
MAPAAKLVIVNVIAEHDVEADEELARERDFRLGPAAAVKDREVPTPEIVIGAGGERGGLPEDPPQQGVCLAW